MFRALFYTTLVVTLGVNIIFLFATKDKPPDLTTQFTISTPTITSKIEAPTTIKAKRDNATLNIVAGSRRLVLRRSNTIESLNDYDDSANNINLSPANRVTPAPNYNGRQVSTVGSMVAPQSYRESDGQSTIAAREARRGEPIDEVDDNDDESGDANATETNGQTTTSQLSSPLSYSPSSSSSTDFSSSTSDLSSGGVTRLLEDQPEEINSSEGSAVREVKSAAGAQTGKLSSLASDATQRQLRRRRRRRRRRLSVHQVKPSGWSTSTVQSRARRHRNQEPPARGFDWEKQKLLQISEEIKTSEESRYKIGDNNGNNNSNNNNTRWLDIRVKSSRGRVSVRVNRQLVYDSETREVIFAPLASTSASSMKKLSTSATATTTPPSEQTNNDSNNRGIHVLVLNQFDGYLMSSRVFDTYLPNQDEELCHYLEMIQDGRLLILAVKDEATFKMAPTSIARKSLQKLGSRFIKQLQWRDMWALILRKQSLSETDLQVGESLKHHIETHSKQFNLAESLSKSASFSNWAEPLEIWARVPLLDGGTSTNRKCLWQTSNSSAEDERRREFCNRIEGYGQVCDCDANGNSLVPITFAPPKIENNQLSQVPILVMASNRPYYLYRMLRSLLAADGIDSRQVVVFIDGFYHEPLMVCRLLNLRVVQQKPQGQRSARISHHYKSSLTAAFELFPEAQFAIIFEEDLDISRDALVYFNQTLGFLRDDPTLYCVSCWNDQGYEHTVGQRDNLKPGEGSGGLIYRIETMPGLGWMLSRQFFKQELELNWPSVEHPHDWDMWIRTSSVRKGRECLIPDISRTFHFGSMGTNINSYFQREYFSKHAFYLQTGDSKPEAKFANLNRLKSEEYERMMEQLVRSANVIELKYDSIDLDDETSKSRNATNFLCSLINRKLNYKSHDNQLASAKDEIIKKEEERYTKVTNSNKHDVIFIEMIDQHDFRNWLKLAKCWHIWDLDARGQHKSAWRLHLSGRPTLVIGAPASPYSHLKPEHLIPFNLA